jgi:hypothetical protein
MGAMLATFDSKWRLLRASSELKLRRDRSRLEPSIPPIRSKLVVELNSVADMTAKLTPAARYMIATYCAAERKRHFNKSSV